MGEGWAGSGGGGARNYSAAMHADDHRAIRGQDESRSSLVATRVPERIVDGELLNLVTVQFHVICFYFFKIAVIGASLLSALLSFRAKQSGGQEPRTAHALSRTNSPTLG